MRQLLLCLLLVGTVYANDFTDVPENHWARIAIESLADQGLLIGFPDGQFKGSQAFSRYENAVILNNLLSYIMQLNANQHAEYSTYQEQINYLSNRLEDLTSNTNDVVFITLTNMINEVATLQDNLTASEAHLSSRIDANTTLMNTQLADSLSALSSDLTNLRINNLEIITATENNTELIAKNMANLDALESIHTELDNLIVSLIDDFDALEQEVMSNTNTNTDVILANQATISALATSLDEARERIATLQSLETLSNQILHDLQALATQTSSRDAELERTMISRDEALYLSLGNAVKVQIAQAINNEFADATENLSNRISTLENATTRRLDEEFARLQRQQQAAEAAHQALEQRVDDFIANPPANWALTLQAGSGLISDQGEYFVRIVGKTRREVINLYYASNEQFVSAEGLIQDDLSIGTRYLNNKYGYLAEAYLSFELAPALIVAVSGGTEFTEASNYSLSVGLLHNGNDVQAGLKNLDVSVAGRLSGEQYKIDAAAAYTFSVDNIRLRPGVRYVRSNDFIGYIAETEITYAGEDLRAAFLGRYSFIHDNETQENRNVPELGFSLAYKNLLTEAFLQSDLGRSSLFTHNLAEPHKPNGLNLGVRVSYSLTLEGQ